MLTLLLNEKPTSVVEARARTEGLPVQSWVYGVLCFDGKKYNQPSCDTLLSPAGVANLKRILAKVAHTNPGALFKLQKKGTKTVATPFSNLWFSSTFTLGSMFRKSKTPVAKPLKPTSMVGKLAMSAPINCYPVSPNVVPTVKCTPEGDAITGASAVKCHTRQETGHLSLKLNYKINKGLFNTWQSLTGLEFLDRLQPMGA